ncbi:MAG: tetratricopeptide (TPR) repeat protein [Flavobacterium sp.]|jgi:tetratricopeptide (TPR) repeat protein
MKTDKYLKAAVKLQKMGRVGKAEKVYLRIIEDELENHDALQLQGLVLAARGQNKEAAIYIEKAISLQPEIAVFHYNIAGIYLQTGRMQDAESSFRKAIKLKPDYGEAYQGLSEMLKFETDDPLIDKIQAQLNVDDVSESQLSYMNFAAGKLFADTGDHQKHLNIIQKPIGLLIAASIPQRL